MKDMPKRCNTQGKLYTDINEYLINLAKQEKETLKLLMMIKL